MVQSGARATLGLRVADLEVWLDAGESGVALAAPVCHVPFLSPVAPADVLLLHVRHGLLGEDPGWRPVFYDAETWQLWRDGAGRHVFVAPRHSPPRRWVTADSGFRCGETVGEFAVGAAPELAIYPLQDIDMMIYVNWLAQSGDFVVHASGVAYQGQGYCFVGPSGAGKSTLATAMAAYPGVTVLGEDQVIVRYLGGRFVVFGTPWHTNPARCSPLGVPLKKLFFLDRTVGHAALPCSRTSGVKRLLQDAFIPYYNSDGVGCILDTLSHLAEQIPFYTLGFRLGSDVLALVQEA